MILRRRAPVFVIRMMQAAVPKQPCHCSPPAAPMHSDRDDARALCTRLHSTRMVTVSGYGTHMRSPAPNRKCLISRYGFPTGQNRNHDIMGMLPITPKAVEWGLASPDLLFPHKSSAKIPVLSNGVSHQKQTPYPPKHKNCHHEFKDPLYLWPCSWRWATRQNEHRNFEGVCIQCICAVLSIGHTTIASGYDRVRRFIESRYKIGHKSSNNHSIL